MAINVDDWHFKDHDFSYDKAHWFANLASLAYAQPLTARKILKSAKFADIQFFDNNGAQAYGLEKRGIVFLAFRGTEPTAVNDVVADAKAWHTKSETIGSVHAGFKGEVDKLWPEIENWLEKHEDKPIFVTGHSLGGAMATVATSRLPATTKAYTFGSPRAGSGKFKRNFNKTWEMHRFVNNNDAVCRVPFALMLFQHCGTLHYINTYGNIRNATPWQRFKDRFRGYKQAWKKGQVFDSLYDHSMDRYTKRICAFCDR